MNDSHSEGSTEHFHTEEEVVYLPNWQIAAWAADGRKATEIRVLDLTEVTTFADTFLICTAGNSRQAQAITDAVQQALKKEGESATSIEGFEQGEWILSDYGDLIVHVFSEKAREFYDLDRLWRQAKPVTVPANPDQREDMPFRMEQATAASEDDDEDDQDVQESESFTETTPIPED